MMLDKETTLVLFGRSPYINKIANYVPDLCKKYPTIACNTFVNVFPCVENVIFFDNICPDFKEYHNVICPIKRSFKGSKAYEKLLNHSKKELYQCSNGTFEFKESLISNCLSVYYHTPTMAMNWAYLKGYKTVILAGVDLIRNTEHFDNPRQILSWSEERTALCKKHIEYVNEKHLKLYNLNPNANMDIPRITIGELLNA